MTGTSSASRGGGSGGSGGFEIQNALAAVALDDAVIPADLLCDMRTEANVAGRAQIAGHPRHGDAAAAFQQLFVLGQERDVDVSGRARALGGDARELRLKGLSFGVDGALLDL